MTLIAHILEYINLCCLIAECPVKVSKMGPEFYLYSFHKSPLSQHHSSTIMSGFISENSFDESVEMLAGFPLNEFYGVIHSLFRQI